MSIDRRTLLRAASGASALALAGRALPAFAQSAPPVTTAQFAAISAALTGYPAPGDATAAKMMRTFATPARRAPLAALAKLVAATPAPGLDAAITQAGLDPVANDLAAAWFSGIVTQGSAQTLVLYTDALMWTAMTFSKPMGVCGGPTNYWGEPPR